MYIYIYIYIYVYASQDRQTVATSTVTTISLVNLVILHDNRHSEIPLKRKHSEIKSIVAIFCPFSKFCEIDISLLNLQTQPKTAPNLFQREVEYGKYGESSNSP